MDTSYNLDAFRFDTITPIVKDLPSQDQTEHDTASLATESKSNSILLTPSPTEVKKSIKPIIAVESAIPPGLLIKERIGKKGLMGSQIYSCNHNATPLLQIYATQGYPVDCGKIGFKNLIEAVLLHGPHKSARSFEARTVLQ